MNPRLHFLLLVLGVSLLAACMRSPTVVKIALVMPFEGAEREKGYDALYAARLAVREINTAGGINGRYLTLVALDDSADPELALRVARGVVADPAVIAVIGHGNPATTRAVLPIYSQAALPLLPLEMTFPAQDLPADFLAAYAAVTPFDETAGPLAGPTYDRVQLIAAALDDLALAGKPDRATLATLLQETEIQGITGSLSGSSR